MSMGKVAVIKAPAMMSPCARCGANAYQGCRLPGHEGEALSECPQYAPTQG
jgi:hypothetical protein